MPPNTIAKRIPLPALAAAGPVAPKIPVPMIMPAVRSVAVVVPSLRAREVLGPVSEATEFENNIVNI